jgi:uncharacterized protein YjdB
MHFPRVVIISLVLGLIGFAGCGDNASQAPDVTLESIAITPGAPSVAAGTSLQLVATGTYSDATTANLSNQVTWSVSASTVATISATGLLQGIAPGTVTVTASLDGISGSRDAAITAGQLTSIAVTPANPTLAAGTSTTLTATGTFSDRSTQDLTSQVTWSSDNTSHVTVAATGTVTAVAAGPSTITAKLGTVVGTTTVTVSSAVLTSLAIESDPQGPLSVAVGHALQLTAVGTFSDGSKQVLGAEAHWAVVGTAVATISATGLLATLTVGEVTVNVTDGDLHAMATVTVIAAVLDSLEVTPATASVAAGLDQPFVAIATLSDGTHPDVSARLQWSVEDTTIAKISSTGVATTKKAGDTTVTASVDTISGVAALHVTAAVMTAIAVTPSNPTVSAGGMLQFHATGQFTDGGTLDLPLALWASEHEPVATITATGLATAGAKGSSEITAKFEGITGRTTLNVTDAVLDSITITPAEATVAKGLPQAFIATGNYSDGSHPIITEQVQWTSSEVAFATISTAGVASTHAEGEATITAALDGKTQTATLTVDPAVLKRVDVTPLTASVIPGATQQYTATGILTDDSSVPLTATATWSSDHPELATVSDTGASKGLVTGVAVGTATITATSGGFTGAATVVVLGPSVTTAAPASGVTDIPTSTAIAISFNQPIDPATVTAQLGDGPCTGSLQLSASNFASCVGFAAQPATNATNTVATAVPAARLAPFANYKIRVLGTIANAAGVPIGVDVVQPIGFTTQGLCPARVVVSQVYGGGGNNNSLFRNDFIELHNVGAAPVSLDGFAIQFASAGAASAWAAQEIPAGTTVPGGGYFLIQEAVGSSPMLPTIPLLPTPDFIPTTPTSGGVPGFAIGMSSGKIALTPMTTVLTGACSAILLAVRDLVGFGSTASCFEAGGTAAAAPANPTAVLRNDDGCQDTDANNLDFSVRAPTPRNAATPPVRCSCAGSTATN